ncbi:hypothetical protein TNCV_4428001 [Trichonephila clavipes]|nr:hypothetical protein TNCV_4428001 [Trichonephila clavipes]
MPAMVGYLNHWATAALLLPRGYCGTSAGEKTGVTADLQWENEVLPLVLANNVTENVKFDICRQESYVNLDEFFQMSDTGAVA